MNERIKELAKQASYRIIETDGAPVISTEFDKEKFAELIIRECADRIRFCIKNDIDFIAEDIEKYFGIEL